MAWRNLRRTASGGTVQDIKLAATYMLLGQTEWVLRRTETVTFTSEGSTRRHIAFDCMLPNNERSAPDKCQMDAGWGIARSKRIQSMSPSLVRAVKWPVD